MSQNPFYNVHAHVFNTDCAPDNFLRVIPAKIVRKYPNTVKRLLEKKFSRWLISSLFLMGEKKQSNKRNELDKYIAFLNVALQKTQLDVFRMALEAGTKYDSNVRIVGLSMNMDYMDNRPSKNQISYTTQLEGLKDIKRYYPTQFFPFLGVDPRHKSGEELIKWAKNYLEIGLLKNGKVYPYFCGIKLYPALGFFPFDPRLDEFYAYCEKYELPIMTHCTRVGSQYIGSKIKELIPIRPPMITPSTFESAEEEQKFHEVQNRIYQRIEAYDSRGWIKDNELGDNDYACDLFSHPDNYICLLQKFPKLKICLAHIGGTNEIIDDPKGVSSELKEIRTVDPKRWFDLILEMMKDYPNLYTDISYTVSDLDQAPHVAKIVTMMEAIDQNGIKLKNRVLFGTDFFMTEQEKHESDLYQLAKENLAVYYDQITRDNPQIYLKQ